MCAREPSETQYSSDVIVEMDWLPWDKVKHAHMECSKFIGIFTSIGKSKCPKMFEFLGMAFQLLNKL